ncbi:SecDF P1 head subdomain-containing protein [Sphingomonas sp. MS122]|uniref:SecDF P1 head subdomain-containing protein n=1 Tax=Sphingomonas sp. MS122 TaxID=3412683 RepID=UPI003C2D095E
MSLLLATMFLAAPVQACTPPPRIDDTAEMTTSRTLEKSGTGLWIAGVRFNGEDIVRAAPDREANDPGWAVDLMLTKSGREKFATIQRCRVAQLVEISFDRVAVSRPNLVEPIEGNVIRIAGNFTQDAATDLAARIRRVR